MGSHPLLDTVPVLDVLVGLLQADVLNMQHPTRFRVGDIWKNIFRSETFLIVQADIESENGYALDCFGRLFKLEPDRLESSGLHAVYCFDYPLHFRQSNHIENYWFRRED